MTTLVIAGLGHAPGKTAVAVGLGQRWRAVGLHVGYGRVDASGLVLTAENDPDVAFVLRVFGGQGVDLPGVRQEAFGTTVAVRDYAQRFAGAGVLLVEVAGDVAEPGTAEAARAMAEDAGAKVLLVAGYRQGLSGPATSAAAGGLGDGLLGAIVNGVPMRYLPFFLGGFALDGVPLLGVVPESRTLAGFTVSELAGHLGAEYLAAKDGGDGVVEHLMLGANITDTATTYFLPKEHMAVFCRVDRPDLQLAALNLSARCLVLTGTGTPQESLMYRAEDLGVPVLRVLTDTLDTVARLDGLVEAGRFRKGGKIPAIRDLLQAHADLSGLDNALGL